MTLFARPCRLRSPVAARSSSAWNSCGKPKPPSRPSAPALSVSRRVNPSHARRGEPSIVNMMGSSRGWREGCGEGVRYDKVTRGRLEAESKAQGQKMPSTAVERPTLETGDNLTRDEFIRIWEQMP